MHQHRHPEHCSVCQPWPDWARHLAAHLNRIEIIMTQANENQQHLDTDVQQLTTAITAITTEIGNLKTANPAVDFTGLDAAIEQAQTLTPADTPPADQPPAEPTPPAPTT